MKNDQEAHGWMFTAEVNHPFSGKFSRTEALTHPSVLWDLKLAVHALDVYVLLVRRRRNRPAANNVFQSVSIILEDTEADK